MEKEYEDVNFETEKIIDTEDLEHVHVKSCKSEERRLSFQQQIQTSELVQMCEQVENIIEEKMLQTCSTESDMTATTETKYETFELIMIVSATLSYKKMKRCVSLST